MNMLTMNPADIVAQQTGVARASPPVSIPIAAPAPAQVQEQEPEQEQQRQEAETLAAESYDQVSDDEVEVVEDEDDL